MSGTDKTEAADDLERALVDAGHARTINDDEALEACAQQMVGRLNDVGLVFLFCLGETPGKDDDQNLRISIDEMNPNTIIALLKEKRVLLH